MTQTITTTLVDTCKNICPFFLSEAEESDYPYAVYDVVLTPHRTKDGIYKYVGAIDIFSISEDADEAQSNANAIEEAIASDMNSGNFISKLLDCQKQCQNGVWIIGLRYNITEFV